MTRRKLRHGTSHEEAPKAAMPDFAGKPGLFSHQSREEWRSRPISSLSLVDVSEADVGLVKWTLEKYGIKTVGDLVGRSEDQINANMRHDIEDFEVSTRVFNALQSVNVKYLWQLVQKTDAELLKCHNFGRKSLKEVKELLAGLGLSLGMKLDEETLRQIQIPQAEINANLRHAIEDIEFSTRVANVLQNQGVEYVYQLVQKTDTDLLKCWNFGRKSLKEVKEVLATMGLTLGMKLDEETLRAVQAPKE